MNHPTQIFGEHFGRDVPPEVKHQKKARERYTPAFKKNPLYVQIAAEIYCAVIQSEAVAKGMSPQNMSASKLAKTACDYTDALFKEINNR